MPALSACNSLSLSAHTLFTSTERESERERVRKREREGERGRERQNMRDLIFISTRKLISFFVPFVLNQLRGQGWTHKTFYNCKLNIFITSSLRHYNLSINVNITSTKV